ncbi:hypothetical protein PN836_019055 [Ningiella sp. W23]|uniref:hypothetical protein n=1 Tax=Ningiella sp. W23 TaxID=3023715 RepID=UPI0037576787
MPHALDCMPSLQQSALKDKIASAILINLKPALYLQLIALCLALSYFYWDAAQPTFSFFAELKSTYGRVFAILSTSIFGGLIPFLILLRTGQVRGQVIQQMLFYCLLWGFMGFVIDEFYQFQSVMFGDDNALETVVKKVLCDQFIFSAFFASPFLTFWFLFRDCRFSVTIFTKTFHFALFINQVFTTLVSTWIVWIPAVSIIYSMPSDLQVPLFNLVLCMFVLIVAIVNSDKESPQR